MSMPIYASPEQFMRDRSEYARKGIARGRSVIATTFADGVLFVAENHSPSLHKVSEIYDRLGFAAVGRYNEFENLRTAGIRLADVRGYSYDRRDVTGRWLANAYAQTLGSIFSEHQKPFEVGICVGEVAENGGVDQLYQISYDGSISDETTFLVMGGTTEPVVASMRESFTAGWSLGVALRSAATALGTVGDSAPRTLTGAQLEVAVLDRRRTGRTFRRIAGAELDLLLAPPTDDVAPPPVDEQPALPGVPGDAPAAGGATPEGVRGPDEAPFEG
ncbi:proteasome subunit alpha [Nakamurella deserti]|uniref:proteasome subunit alpha n=1 Tax=Nakamurella deserti TaxID=2164074 RepID=UPI000DBE6464|nr:proteasome subunit alpha [Nakamurella deserti]